MTDYRVVLPKERYLVATFRQKRKPGVAVINSALQDFEPKVVFAWHLSIMLRLEDLAQRGMPTRKEQEVVDAYGERLSRRLKVRATQPNVLFLARITWNATRELIWRVYDPEIANAFLQREIETERHAREFDFRMDHDPKWRLARWHLGLGKKSKPNKAADRMAGNAACKIVRH